MTMALEQRAALTSAPAPHGRASGQAMRRKTLATAAALILHAAERCRDILKQLSAQPEEGDALFADIGLKALLEEVAEPHRGFDLDFDITVKIPAGQDTPRLRRLPEVVHGLSTLVENAADFATARVQPAEPPFTFTGKHDTMKPSGGRASTQSGPPE